MDFATTVQESKSGRNALNAFKRLNLLPKKLPRANELDPTEALPLNQEEKVFKRMASTILRLADAEWWANAPKMPMSHLLVGALQGLSDHGYTIEILSSPFGEASKEGKLQWCKKNLPEEFTTYNIRSDKETLASQHTLLIDDREKVCRKFKEAGGHTVLFDEDWFLSLRKAFKGNSITTVYVDLDGVLVDTKRHIIEALESL